MTLSIFTNPKQVEGLRLLLTPFAHQQFNLTADRRSERPSLGVACFVTLDDTVEFFLVVFLRAL